MQDNYQETDMPQRYGTRWSLVGLGLLFIGGCSGSGPPLPDLSKSVLVSGIVTMGGKPVESATVTFHPKQAAGFHGANGVTDASGKYELEMDAGNGKTKKGVFPGKYDVTVTKLVRMDGTPVKFDPKVEGPMSQGAVKQAIPMQYSSVNDHGLYFDVPAGGGTYDIKMDE
jgi:hypothetical protein